ncbi:unnamed protein product, partial [marine sediment metagenome]
SGGSCQAPATAKKNADSVLTYLDDVMQEFDLESNQQIGTLLNAIQEADEEDDNPRDDDDGDGD